jgi:hypothetical protein
MARAPETCRWIGLREALTEFVLAEYGTTSQRHIKPLHWYVACRLCLEGGFDPDEITPRPPFMVAEQGSGASRRRVIQHEPESGGYGEQTILGGLKTKQVDVVVTKPGIGPVIAISMKGTLNALRNLTNRLEEAGGDCTNLHLTYPSLVYAYWAVIRANRAGDAPAHAPPPFKTDGGRIRSNDVVMDADGKPGSMVERYHLALSGLADRDGIRNDVSKYEAVALTLVSVDEGHVGEPLPEYPPPGSPLSFEGLMPAIYRHYDLRFVLQAPDLAPRTRRNEWDEESPVRADWNAPEYELRMAGRP